MDGLRLPEAMTYDATTIVSELASNVWRHALGGSTPTPLPPAGLPELAVYLRGTRPELVVSVFDSAPWRGPLNPDTLRPPPSAETGRGLEVLSALVAEHDGSWEVHRTRSRLGAAAVPGKAVTFTLPLPTGPGCPRRAMPTVREAAAALRAELTARRVGPLCGGDGWGMAVINVSADLTIWVRDGHFAVPSLGRHPLTDAVDVAEQIVRLI